MPHLIYEKRDAVAYLTMNRPERMNAMNYAMRNELREFFMERLVDLETRVIVITESIAAIFYEWYGTYLPLYMLALGVDEMQIGVLSSVLVLSKLVSTLLGGYVADRFGRKRAPLGRHAAPAGRQDLRHRIERRRMTGSGQRLGLIVGQALADVHPMAVVCHDVERGKFAQVKRRIPGRKEHPPSMRFVSHRNTDFLLQPQRFFKISASFIAGE